MTTENEFAFDTMQGRMALMIGMMGMSGSGKTESAIALATGMASVTGGPVVVIDTESGRALHKHRRNGGRFEFKHINFEPDHSTLRYLKAIDYAIEQGAGAIVVDSYSHEHEGIGGALEQAGAELERLTKGDSSKRDSFAGMQWMAPKRNRKAVVNRLLQKRVPIVFCFRAKDGIDFNFHDPVTLKRKPRAEGLVPLGDRQFFYDMTVNFVFRAGSDGVPDWHPNIRTEPVTRYLAKCPGQFRKLLGYDSDRPPQVTEELGVAFARWAEGNQRDRSFFETFHAALEGCASTGELKTIGEQVKACADLTEVDKNELRALAQSRAQEFKAAS